MTLLLLHMDWIGCLLCFVAQFMISFRRWQGWVFNVLSSVAFLYVDIYAKLWGMIPCCLMLIALGVWTAHNWRHTALRVRESK